MTNTSGCPGSDRSLPTGTVPPRPFSPGINSATGLARTPAVHITVRAVIEVPSSNSTPSGVTRVRLSPRRTSTPFASRVPNAARWEAGENPGSR